MNERFNNGVPWHARGLLFENCSCQLVCPGHVHFDQFCTHPACRGHWAIRIDEGMYGDTSLAGVKAVVVYDTPQHMIDGNWTEGLIIDANSSPEQRAAIEAILTGRAGGPWAVLARFVGRWLDTRYLPVTIVEDGPTRRVSVEGVLDSAITEIRGRDRSKPVVFENMFNQVHAPTQVLARGFTKYDDGTIEVNNEGTHGLYSNFEWMVRGA